MLPVIFADPGESETNWFETLFLSIALFLVVQQFVTKKIANNENEMVMVLEFFI